MPKDTFLKRFKAGSEAWKVLLVMAFPKERAVHEKVKWVARGGKPFDTPNKLASRSTSLKGPSL
jgi:Tfp pilus assembly protein PilZ